ncbi:ATP-dependent DNA ligase [Streptomyces sp. NBC_00440]|uniref:ATP-dependent DNA ligase n=1 Tax=Streptomyces sp. NBC_00440 TaxID=2975741 RepID=UPI002E1CD6C3
MLARTAKTLPRPDALPGGTQYEAKVDGFRCLIFTGSDGVFLQSRSGSLALTRAFPEVVDAAAALRDEGMVLDGELVAQNEGRLDFPALQARARHTKSRARELATQSPAEVILFDVLQLRGRELLDVPLYERRTLLEDLFVRRALEAPWALCPATGDVVEAAAWLDPAWGRVGVEGCVAKARNGRYQPSARGWTKVRSRESAEAVIGAVTGSRAHPSGVLLGRWDQNEELRLVARSTPLPARLRAELAGLLAPAGAEHPWHGVRFAAGWGSRDLLNFTCVQPDVVGEFEGDAAIDRAGGVTPCASSGCAWTAHRRRFPASAPADRLPGGGRHRSGSLRRRLSIEV